MTVKQARRLYRARPDVLYAEPNYYRYADQSPLTPNDPLYSDMWNLHNTGQSGGTPGADIHASEAWGLSTGSSTVVVAVIDSGIAYSHPDLAANVWSSSTSYTVRLAGRSVTCPSGTLGFNTITMTCDPKDDNGHGTHVSGTIGASGNNGAGVVGINWHVQVMACKFLDAGGGGYTSDEITCLEYLALMKDRGVNLVATNNSYGGGGFSQAEKDAIDSHRQRGILFIAAAGNSRVNNDLASSYPANYGLPHMMSVAATDRNDALADFSNFGRHSVHLGAPGVEILSTVPPGTYGLGSGTSMAAPHVTGVAALLKAQDGSHDWKAIKNLILAGGDTIPAVANTVSQKRLSAYGSLACSNTVLQQRIQPRDADVYVGSGDSLTFEVLNINCGAPNGLLEVPVDGGPETVILADDGVGPDLEANDGIYVAQRQWLASEIGDHTLAFPNNDIVTVHVLPPLSAYAYSTAVPFNYREFEGTDLALGDDDSATIRPPFPIQFGGTSFATLNVNSNGNVTFGPFLEWDNSPLPVSSTAVLVAPFWDDLNGNARWGVAGSPPNRELVIEWPASKAMACVYSELPTSPAKFQIVFFEGSSDILFNYADVRFIDYEFYDPLVWGCIGEVNAGASATVGVQSRSNLANQFSFNTASLKDSFSILWRLGQVTPSITQLSPFAALVGGPAFSLRVIGQSFLPGAAVRWNGSNRLTTFVNGGELTANISAADLAAAGTAQITVLNPTENGGPASTPSTFRIHSSYPVPTVTDVVPNPVPLQVPADVQVPGTSKVTLNGADFVPGSVVLWNRSRLETLVRSRSQLQATVPSNIMSVGTASVTVFNPAPGGGTSNVLLVSVVNPVPAIRRGYGSVPLFVGAGAAAFSMSVGGINLTPTSVVRWNGSDRPTNFLNGYALTASIPASDVALLGTAQVTVFNPAPGGGTSNALTVSIITPPANDKFANAIVIPSYPFTFTENTAGATIDPLDPRPPCIASPPDPQESVWFSFTPPSGGAHVTMGTSGSNYDNLLTAWTGSPGNFVNLGCTFNSGWPDANNPPLSLIGSLTSPIYIMVSSTWMGTAGTLVFSLDVGSGPEPSFALAANPISNGVARGSPATYTITVAPQNGSFTAPIALSCSVVPAGPTCSLSPSSVTPGSAPASVTLTVATTNVARLEMPGQPASLFAYWLALPAFGLLAVWRTAPAARKARLVFLALVLIVASLGLLPSCGGGGGGGTPPPQMRNFIITVTGTSGTISQQTSASLTVTF
jgi:hypothetical protein